MTEIKPVAWQFQDRDGNWRNFLDETHRKYTIEDGEWEVRELYDEPAVAALRKENEILRLTLQLAENHLRKLSTEAAEQYASEALLVLSEKEDSCG